jgi:hypothetical protein
MSHITFYIHMFTSRMLGSMADGDGRFAANWFFTREQSVGGSKNSNDTVSTFFSRLLGGRSGWASPSIYRSGFDGAGIVESLIEEASSSST